MMWQSKHAPCNDLKGTKFLPIKLNPPHEWCLPGKKRVFCELARFLNISATAAKSLHVGAGLYIVYGFAQHFTDNTFSAVHYMKTVILFKDFLKYTNTECSITIYPIDFKGQMQCFPCKL